VSARKILAFVVGVAVVAVVGPLTAVPAFSQDNGTVPATVTVAAPCLTVSQTTAVDYGVVGFNNAASASLGTVTNCSTGSAQSLRVRGTDATSTGSTTWQLGGSNCATPTLNTYEHRLSLDNGTALNGRYLSTTDYVVPTSMPASASWSASGMLEMPCSGSDGQGKTYNFSVIFTATF
jgi:hypothetical protein